MREIEKEEEEKEDEEEGRRGEMGALEMRG